MENCLESLSEAFLLPRLPYSYPLLEDSPSRYLRLSELGFTSKAKRVEAWLLLRREAMGSREGRIF
jgi:hypothetical protein